MNIHVASFDFNGCLSNKAYNNKKGKQYRKIVESNLAFLNHIKLQNQEKQYSQLITMIGSDIQSVAINSLTSQNGQVTCYTEMQEVSKHLGATLEPMLLADIFADLEEGKSFEYATLPDYQGEHAKCPIDESKLLIVYAQIQKIAKQYPHEQIEFDFYNGMNGDSNQKSFNVLRSLAVFFENNPLMIPDNVTLNLNHFSDKKLTLVKKIKGTGLIDNQYQNTIKEMYREAVNVRYPELFQTLSTADTINVNIIQQPLDVTKINPSNLTHFKWQKKHISSLQNILKEWKEVEHNLAISCSYVVDAFTQSESAGGLNSEELNFLKTTRDHFAVIAQEGTWDNIIPADIEKKTPTELYQILQNMRDALESESTANSKVQHFISYSWLATHYLELNNLLSKNNPTTASINQIFEQQGHNLTAQSLTIKPLQNTLKMSLLAVELKKNVSSFPAVHPGREAVESMQRKFARLGAELNALQKKIPDDKVGKFIQLIADHFNPPDLLTTAASKAVVNNALKKTVRIRKSVASTTKKNLEEFESQFENDLAQAIKPKLNQGQTKSSEQSQSSQSEDPLIMRINNLKLNVPITFSAAREEQLNADLAVLKTNLQKRFLKGPKELEKIQLIVTETEKLIAAWHECHTSVNPQNAQLFIENHAARYERKCLQTSRNQKFIIAGAAFLGGLLGTVIGATIGFIAGAALGGGVGSVVPVFGNIAGAISIGSVAGVITALKGAGVGAMIGAATAAFLLGPAASFISGKLSRFAFFTPLDKNMLVLAESLVNSISEEENSLS